MSFTGVLITEGPQMRLCAIQGYVTTTEDIAQT